MTVETQTNGGVKQKLDWATFSNVVNGKLVQTSKTRHTPNPSTLEANPEVPVCALQDVDEAVAHARVAAKKWAATPLAQRQQAVLDFAGALREHAADFAAMLTREQGKPTFLAHDELNRSVQWLEDQAKLPFPEELVEDNKERIVKTRYVPLGVAVAIVPWNSCGKIAPALVTGNALIIKPSPFTPYCNLKLAELAQQFFPPGVVQALSGDDNLGPWLTAHEGIDKVSFTGSTATGKLVMQSCAKTLKRVTLELGGNDPAIVFPDVDIVDTATKICVAIKRIYVHASIYQPFLEAFVAVTKSLQVGDGMTEGVFVGPIQNKMQYDRVKGFLDDVHTSKANVAFGGSDGADGAMGKGYFVQPTVIDNPKDNSRIVMEEPFGPVVPLLKFDSEEDVIARANNSEAGLGASVWSKDLQRAERVASQLEAGSVWVNSHLDLRPDAAFGGHKKRGLGAEWGVVGLRGYCNAQTITMPKA
ncbi:aldehyde dehydrogenase [Microdochium trichocladiopsis]|uniref:aldehyde dehydrogenase (NAD(+)) n=1 Tax=Microdochium trichocladiopsis TaxID=1682393 RepID=A0A9P8XTP6_9PEZI|nr:aldehyde dehydrogenase [Microdochium trichocladiopsis]KAH7014164.1 aldehyde dehydrogenase [Microdochium trichocladiopsis]